MSLIMTLERPTDHGPYCGEILEWLHGHNYPNDWALVNDRTKIVIWFKYYTDAIFFRTAFTFSDFAKGFLSGSHNLIILNVREGF